MTRRLDSNSRDILEFRPSIGYVEPEVGLGQPTPDFPDELTTDNILASMRKYRAMANAVNVLATAVQARADLRAEGMRIKLDPIVDAGTVAAMQRMYPEDDPLEITYDQYKDCKERTRKRGEKIAKDNMMTKDDVNEAKEKLGLKKTGIRTAAQPGGFGTEEARTGGLRPELHKPFQIIPPLDIKKFQDILIRILINFLWKNFVKPTIASALGPVAGPAFKTAAPDVIAPLPEGFTTQDIIEGGGRILGEESPQWQTDLAGAIPPIPEIEPQPTSLEEVEEL